MTIGEKIKHLRKQQNISVDELASKLGKNRATVYRYEKGDIENLPLATLVPLAKALNTTPAHLMGWDETKEDITKELFSYWKEVPTERLKLWLDHFRRFNFTENEVDKIIEYANFIAYIRKN